MLQSRVHFAAIEVTTHDSPGIQSMKRIPGIHLTLSLIATLSAVRSEPVPARRIDGYRGIWFELGQKSEFGDKYSGGLGTYTANHAPMAVYSPEADKTFFVDGGSPSADKRQLLAIISDYDHKTGKVPQPAVVMDKSPVGTLSSNILEISQHERAELFDGLPVAGWARKSYP
jgi:hypothetical protein